MFDITSYVREKIFRRPKLNNIIAWEELSEKQTTKLGYFLLYCMFWAILVSAQWTLSIIKDIPNRPTSIPYCINDRINTFDNDYKNNNSYSDYWYYNYWYNDCQVKSENPKFDFNPEFNNLEAPYNEIVNYKKNITELENQKRNIDYNQRNNQQDYNTSLTEKIADENAPLYDTETIQENIKNNRLEGTNIDSQINTINSKIDQIKSQYNSEILALEQKFEKANDDYRTAYLLYRFYVAILSFLFSIIVLTILYKMYVIQKIKNSPHTIIFSVATFAYWLVLLQISALFIWDIIPHKLLEIVIKLFSLFTPLVYIVQFLWPILIIAIFWFLVYKIQKRLYSPKNVLKRFISDKKCPNCWNSVDFTKPFCPLCSNEIQIHCPLCHELTLKWMPYCSNCWWNLPEQDIISYKNNDLLDESLETVLNDINTDEYKWVKFTSIDWKSFNSTRENIVKIVIFMTNKLWKNKFEPNEFTPYLDEIIKHIKKDKISENELNRLLWKIKSWIEIWWEVALLKK